MTPRDEVSHCVCLGLRVASVAAGRGRCRVLPLVSWPLLLLGWRRLSPAVDEQSQGEQGRSLACSLARGGGLSGRTKEGRVLAALGCCGICAALPGTGPPCQGWWAKGKERGTSQ